MREIRFRAWDNIKKEMFQVAKLDLKNKTVWEGGLGYMINNPNQDIKLLQFTGLKDVNGKEIYEENILEMPVNYHGTRTIRGIVFFEDGCFSIERRPSKVPFNKNKYVPYLDYPTEGFNESKIIGSTYENPELLEAKE